MTPRKFKQVTGVLARPPDMNDEECAKLPVYQGKLGTGKHAHKYCLSCWGMSWRERLHALIFGRVWVWVISGSETQPPIALSVEYNPFEAHQ
jgi:hypothetical protein